jgi:hypothetical protein
LLKRRFKKNVAFCYGFNGYTVGNSMEPELKERDTVLIDQSQKAILACAIFFNTALPYGINI